MKASKFIVLVGGILGLIAFFLPLAKGNTGKDSGDVNISFSAFTVMKGVESVSEISDVDKLKKGMDDASKAAFDEGKRNADAAGAKDLNKVLGEIKPFIAIIFIPTLLFLVLGGIAVKRGKFGRGAGAIALLMGLVGLGLAGLIKMGLEEHAGIAAMLLLATGAAGFVGGMLALIKPERGHIHA